MNITVIANRKAERLAATGELALALPRAAAEVGARLVETQTLDELAECAASLASAGASPNDCVVLAGGDGSYMEGVTALVRAFGDRPLPRIALAPGGTVNTVLHNWASHRSLRREPAAYLRRLLFAIRDGALPVRRPTLRVRDAAGGSRVGFIFGAGLVSRFFELYEREGAGGERAAARIVARLFAGSLVGSPFARFVLDPIPCAMVVDNRVAPLDRASLVAASVVRNVGLHMHLLYRAAEAHDRFHVVATPRDARALGPQLPRVLLGRPLRGPKVDTLARQVAVDFTDGHGAYVLDGDLFRADILEITAGPVLEVISV